MQRERVYFFSFCGWNFISDLTLSDSGEWRGGASAFALLLTSVGCCRSSHQWLLAGGGGVCSCGHPFPHSQEFLLGMQVAIYQRICQTWWRRPCFTLHLWISGIIFVGFFCGTRPASLGGPTWLASYFLSMALECAAFYLRLLPSVVTGGWSLVFVLCCLCEVQVSVSY